jgi:hypothetical protein
MYIFTIGATQCHQLHYFNHHRHSKAKIKFFSRSLDCFCTKAYQWHWRNATGVDYLNIYLTLINALSGCVRHAMPERRDKQERGGVFESDGEDVFPY